MVLATQKPGMNSRPPSPKPELSMKVAFNTQSGGQQGLKRPACRLIFERRAKTGAATTESTNTATILGLICGALSWRSSERASGYASLFPDTCSLTVTVNDSRIIKVRGSDALPYTG